MVFLKRCFKKEILVNLFVSLVALIVCLIVVEIAGHFYAFLNPSYDVLFLQPDRNIGWKQVPGMRYTWAGDFWYARDFSVPIEINSHGFRDLERGLPKPDGTVRVALLGDSLVEALQVPFTKTAGNMLERKLNSAGTIPTEKPVIYEVLNFGISNYSVSQYLIVYEEYAKKFNPDFVFLLVSELQMRRTVNSFIIGMLENTRQKRLSVRPSVRIQEGSVMLKPSRDHDEYVEVQNELIRSEFDGKRIRKKKHRFFLGYLYDRLRQARLQKALGGNTGQLIDWGTFSTNVKIIEELGERVRNNGGRLIIADEITHYNPGSAVFSDLLKKFAMKRGFGYVLLSDYLLEQNRKGVQTRWDHDMHFNERGNEIFAEALYQWMKTNASADR